MPLEEGGGKVVIALGHGREASYAHLQTGSITVHAGERVKVGQTIGRLGDPLSLHRIRPGREADERGHQLPLDDQVVNFP
ncbi:MAG TPA: peptidoglycan DD-metalloendopeptidase family protein [Solirubrobacterales bacterium]|nr:peptidoglycan DD-metalloendopeptidase family protein [Solirubrobacterales bacterium]